MAGFGYLLDLISMKWLPIMLLLYRRLLQRYAVILFQSTTTGTGQTAQAFLYLLKQPLLWSFFAAHFYCNCLMRPITVF